jgi:type IX secretion system PorP/SprF family membrane protein
MDFRIVCLTAIIAFITFRISSGQDAEFSQFFANPLYMNPAFAGTSELGRMTVNYRNQWPGNGTTFKTYAVSYDNFSERYNTGWGVQFMHDRQLNEVIVSNSASMHYSYHLKAGHESFISAGIQAGIVYKQFDPAGLIFPSMIDQLSGRVWGVVPDQLEYARKAYPDLGAGIIGQHRDFFGGLSLHHLNQPDESIMQGDQQGDLPVKFTGHAGARLFRYHRGLFSREFMISPNLIYRHQGSFRQLNTGIYFIEKAFLFGAWYRNNLSVRPDALIFLAGFANSHFQLGYSFDYTLSELSNYSYGSHEISLTFFFGQLEGFPNPRRLLIPVI